MLQLYSNSAKFRFPSVVASEVHFSGDFRGGGFSHACLFSKNSCIFFFSNVPCKSSVLCNAPTVTLSSFHFLVFFGIFTPFGGCQKGGFPKGWFSRRVVLANVPLVPVFRSGGTCERTLVPVFVPGEHPNVPSFQFSFRVNMRQNHPFGKPIFGQPSTHVRSGHIFHVFSQFFFFFPFSAFGLFCIVSCASHDCKLWGKSHAPNLALSLRGWADSVPARQVWKIGVPLCAALSLELFVRGPKI